MKSWLINIAVISVLSAITDMLLPKNQVSRYAKLCVSLLLTITIVRPLICFYNNGFSVELPKPQEIASQEQINLVDKEFSSRLTSIVRNETGFENITLDVTLGYDRVISVKVIGAQSHQKENLTSVLADKYSIPTEIVTYGAD